MDEDFSAPTQRGPRAPPVSVSAPVLPAVVIQPVFGAGGLVETRPPPSAQSARAPSPPPAKPPEKQRRSNDAPRRPPDPPPIAVGGRNMLGRGWGKLKAAVKGAPAFSPVTSRAKDMPEDSDSDASDRERDSEDVERDKDTQLLKVWEDDGPASGKKLFGSKGDEGEKVEGGEGREWKVRYLAVTGLTSAHPILHKLRLVVSSDPTSGLVPVHSWPLSSLRSIALYSTPRSSFIVSFAGSKRLGFQEAKEYVWVAEADDKRGEFLRTVWGAMTADEKRAVKLDGCDSDFGLPPMDKSEQQRERERERERERRREAEREKAPAAASTLSRKQRPAAQPAATPTTPAPESAAPSQVSPSPSPRSTSLKPASPVPPSAASSAQGDYLSHATLAPRTTSLRGGTPTTPAASPFSAPGAPPPPQDDEDEEYDLNLLLSAADRLLARQHLMPPPAPSETLPDLSEVLATFDFRPGGDARELAARVASEADALERGNAWALLHSHAEEPALDRAVARATEELGKVEDRYLRAYAEKLGGMGADVRAIERRNRREGTARDNMERLLKETQGLLARLRLPEGLVETLRTADLGDAAGREAAVRFARVLWARTGEDFGQLASMRAVRDRRTEWAGYVREFGVRIGRHVGGDCERALAAHSKAVAVGKGTPPRVPVARLAEALGGYRELLQWLREADPRAHYEVLGGYVEKVGAFYDKEVKRFAGDVRGGMGGKGNLAYVFAPEQQTSAPTVTISSNIKQTSSAIKDFSATLTRKTVEGIKDSSGTFLATLKRGAKLDVRALEAANASAGATPRASMDADRMSVATKETRGREDGDIDEEGTTGDEAMEMVLTAVAPPLVQQQAFITELFELETKRDATLTKQQTQGSVNGDASNGISRSVSKKDIKWQKRVAETMDRFVPSLVPELVLILDTAVRRDPTSSLGVLVVVEKHQALVAAAALQGVPPSHWMLGVLNRTGDKAKEAFARFLDSQVAIIEETKGMNRKKIGIFDFVRTFPLFVDRMESLLALNPNAPQDPAPPSRQAIAGAYDRISRAMFDSLDAISREVEKAARQEEDEGRRYGSKAAGGGEEDTVIVHVLHIQNMHHLSSELRFRKIPSLEPCVKRAKGLYEYHLAAYTKVVVRRPLGKLLEFFDGVDEMVRNGAEREVAFRQAYSKGALRDLVKKYPGKEIRKSLEVLYKRVEKHFTEDDSTSSLMQVVWRNIQEDFIKRHALFEELIARCYPGSQIHLEFTVQDLLGYFSELARSH